MAGWDDGDAEEPEAVVCEVTEITDEPPSAPAQDDGLALCEVTNKRFPLEDLVEFRGKRVSVEGKRILLRQLSGAARADDGLRRPSFLRRLLCSILDGVLVFIVMAAARIAYGITVGAINPMLLFENLTAFQLGFDLFDFFLVMIYYTIFHAAWGKSRGKMAGGYRVTNPDGSPISFSVSLKRSLFSDGYGIFGVVAIYVFSANSLAVQILLVAYFIADCLVLVFDSSQQRSLHDRLAGTRVIMDRNALSGDGRR